MICVEGVAHAAISWSIAIGANTHSGSDVGSGSRNSRTGPVPPKTTTVATIITANAVERCIGIPPGQDGLLPGVVDDAGDLAPQLAPRHHPVHHPRLQQVLRPLETLRQLL